jgi:hypothetical protein
MQYASFFAVWLLSSLILGVVHGPAMGTFFGLGIASGYLLALRAPAAVVRWHTRLQRGREARNDAPAPNTYI